MPVAFCRSGAALPAPRPVAPAAAVGTVTTLRAMRLHTMVVVAMVVGWGHWGLMMITERGMIMIMIMVDITRSGH